MNIQDIMSLLTEISWREPTWDVFVGVFFILAIVLYGFSMGKSRLVVNMIAMYMAMAVAKSVPNVTSVEKYLSPENMFASQTVVFLFAFVGLYYLLSKKSPLSSVVRSSRKESWSHIVVYSIVHVGLILSTILSFIPNDQLIPLSNFTKAVFTHEVAQFVWVLLPIAVMIVMPENIRRSNY